MAHYAKVNSDNIVDEVITFNDEVEADGGPSAPLPDGWRWIQCSYNTRNGEHLNGGTPLRNTFPGKGCVYNPEHDLFHLPQPHNNWTLNQTTWLWEAPKPRPEPIDKYVWSDEEDDWVLDPRTRD